MTQPADVLLGPVDLGPPHPWPELVEDGHQVAFVHAVVLGGLDAAERRVRAEHFIFRWGADALIAAVRTAAGLVGWDRIPRDLRDATTVRDAGGWCR